MSLPLIYIHVSSAYSTSNKTLETLNMSLTKIIKNSIGWNTVKGFFQVNGNDCLLSGVSSTESILVYIQYVIGLNEMVQVVVHKII